MFDNGDLVVAVVVVGYVQMKVFRKISREQMPNRNHDVVFACEVEEGTAFLFANKPHVVYSVACALRLDLGAVLAFKSESTVVIWCTKDAVGVDAISDERLDDTEKMTPFLIHPLPDDDKNTGLWLSKRITAFREDMGLNYVPGEQETDGLLAVADSGAVELDNGGAELLAQDLGLAFSGRDLPRPPNKRERRSPGVSIDALVFNAWHARAAICAQYLARSERRVRSKTKSAAKRDHCSKCVYACTKGLGACSLTDAEVVARYPDSDDARAWMAAFTWSGHRAVIGRSHVMAWGPSATNVNAPLVYVARKLSPPFARHDHDLEPEEVIGGSWREKIAEEAARIVKNPVDQQARLFWALRQLWAHGRWDYDAYFAQGCAGDGHRRSRNDVLYIQLKRGWSGPESDRFDIKVGSCTKASSYGPSGYGGGARQKSNPIRHDARPRFTTQYTHPYYESLLGWTGEPLGTIKSSIRLRITGQEA